MSVRGGGGVEFPLAGPGPFDRRFSLILLKGF